MRSSLRFLTFGNVGAGDQQQQSDNHRQELEWLGELLAQLRESIADSRPETRLS